MKIIQIFPGKVWGGAEQYVLDLGRALSREGHEVEYLCRDVAAVTARLDSEGIPYRLYGRDLGQELEGADVVHIHDSSFVSPVVKAAPQTRVVLTRHIARASRVWPWQRSRWRKLHAIVFVSELSCRMWRSVNSWMPAQKCVVVHNTIPQRTDADTPAAPPDLRKLYGIDRSTPLLMFTGRVRRSKGCETIIEALSTITAPYAMVFVGAAKPADYPDRLMKLAREKGIADKIHFYGFTSDARSLVSQADIGLQPSIVREAFGLSQLEFMQAGKPVVTTDNGAQPEYIKNGQTGLLIPPDNPKLLAHAIARLINNYPDGCRRMGSKAADYYRTHHPLFLQSIQQIYQK